MSGDTPTRNLDCPGCGAGVFTRADATWYTDEEEHCPGCGSRVMVALDEDAADPDLLTARVYEYESGGDVVARLLESVQDARHAMRLARIDRGVVEAEVERLTSALAVAQAMTAERDGLLESEREASARVAEGFEQLTWERDEARREVCTRRARGHAPRFGATAAYDIRARAIAEELGWSCFEGGS